MYTFTVKDCPTCSVLLDVGVREVVAVFIHENWGTGSVERIVRRALLEMFPIPPGEKFALEKWVQWVRGSGQLDDLKGTLTLERELSMEEGWES